MKKLLILFLLIFVVFLAGCTGYNGPGASCSSNADCSIGLVCSDGSCAPNTGQTGGVSPGLNNSSVSDNSNVINNSSNNFVPVVVDLNLTVTVPYWTNGSVFVGVGDNATYLKLNKVDNVLYSGVVKLNKSSVFYFSRGSLETKSIDSYHYYGNKAVYEVTDWVDSVKEVSSPGFQKGVTFGGMLWNPDSFDSVDYNLNKLSDFGIKWVLIIPDWFVDNNEGEVIYPFYESNGSFPNPTNWITPTLTDEQVRHLIREAKKRGFKVVLKPHVDPMDYGMNPLASRGSLNPPSWDNWFDSYDSFITHYAKIAEEEKVELFVVGTELDSAVRASDSQWRRIIKDVRSDYKGPITYSAACLEPEENKDWRQQCYAPKQVKFWDALDYIGFEPYFGLTNKNNPSVEELKQAFNEKFSVFAEPLAEKYNKKILLTEVAFHSYDGFNKKGLMGSDNGVMDLQEQAELYEALFQSIEENNYIKGTYLWAWYLIPKGTSLKDWVSWTVKGDTGEVFNGKPAGQVIKKWYLKINN